MAEFRYNNHYFKGINPNGITFTRQNGNTCGLLTILNARAALYNRSDITEDQMVEKTGADKGLTAQQLLDATIATAEFTGVTTLEKRIRQIVEFEDYSFLGDHVQKGHPALIQHGTYTSDHAVLVLAHDEQDFLIYNSQPGISSHKAAPSGIPNWAKSGGLGVMRNGEIPQCACFFHFARHVGTKSK